jgi:uncharacterized membrane protein YkvA (DUF1232 family)
MARRSDSRTGRDQASARRDAARGGASAGFRRALTVAAFLPVASRAPLYARLLWSLAIDGRTPASRKALLAVALGYVMVGRDLIPDRIPILGQLDDLVVVAIAIELFLDDLEPALLDEKLAEAGIPRAAYDEDVARVRRLLPGPLRRTVRRVPGALRMAVEAAGRSGLGPRLRGWLTDDGMGAR